VKIVDNLFYGVDAQKWGGTGAFALIGEGPSDITIEHNTVSQSGNILMAYGGTKSDPKPIAGFVFRDNLIRHNQYGVHGSDRAVGADTLDAFFPGAVFESNTIAGGESKRYPKGNTFIGEDDFKTLRGHGFSEEDAWDIAAIAAFFAMSNRLANMSSMRPNDEFYLMGRVPKT